MKNVFLNGDPVCHGSENSTGCGVPVREKLKDEADVFISAKRAV